MKIAKEDLLSSFIVFIVALPLSLGIALASGASLEAGIITAVLGGILCGLLSGAPLVVAGPAAGLTALVFQLVQQYGLKGLAIITIMAGIMQFLMGVFKLGRFFKLMPKAILEGMLSVIGFIIAIYQVHVLLGHKVPSSVVAAFTQLPQALLNLQWPIVFCGVLAVAIQLLWPRLPARFSWIPGALPAVIIATLVSLAWEMPRVQIANFIGHITGAISDFSLSSLFGISTKMLVSAFGLAIVASAETLLTAIALDGLIADRSGKKQKPAALDHDLLAHGFTNAVSGFLGGLPMTGVIVRSAVNVNSGAKTRWSTVFHGIWIALFVLFAPGLLQTIPLTALAAVLVVTGFKLLNASEFMKVLKHSRWQATLWAFTFMSILFTDLLTGLALGVLLFVGGQSLPALQAFRENGRRQAKLKENSRINSTEVAK